MADDPEELSLRDVQRYVPEGLVPVDLAVVDGTHDVLLEALPFLVRYDERLRDTLDLHCGNHLRHAISGNRGASRSYRTTPTMRNAPAIRIGMSCGGAGICARATGSSAKRIRRTSCST